jgi:kynureninase
MENHFQPMKGVDGWMLSNMNILGNAVHLAALDLFEEAGIERLRNKSIQLTDYLDQLLKASPGYQEYFEILTPDQSSERGCQLSLYFKKDGKKIFDYLQQNGVIMDWREPSPPDGHTGVIRIAPTPMYNTFTEVFEFSELLNRFFAKQG